MPSTYKSMETSRRDSPEARILARVSLTLTLTSAQEGTGSERHPVGGVLSCVQKRCPSVQVQGGGLALLAPHRAVHKTYGSQAVDTRTN